MAGNYDGSLKFDTSIDQSGFKDGIGKLGSLAKAGLAAVTGAVTAAGTGIAALGGYAIGVGESFESSMAQVIATMGITKDTVENGVNSFELLQQAAKDAGATTTFSASEAADALNYLALAGYSAEQAADALPAVLNLAAAGGMELAYASDLATDAMAALGIEANTENLTRFGDQLAKTASKANASVSQLGEAILTVGGTAKSLKGGTVELNAALGVLANRGIKGAEGGTALRNMILSLTAPTDKAADKLRELGVEVLDDTGNMRSLDAIFQDLDKSLAGLCDGEKTGVLNEIFNKVDLKSAQAMLAGCGDEFSALTAELVDCDGAMQQMADTMNDTLEGDIKSLQSKAEAFGITVYESMTDPLRELAQLGGDYLTQLTEAFNTGGFDGLASALGDALGDAGTELSEFLYSTDIIGLGADLIASLSDGIADNAQQLINTGIMTVLSLAEGIGDAAVDLLDLGSTLMTALADGLTKRKNTIERVAKTIFEKLTEAIRNDMPLILAAGAEILGMLLEGLTDALPDLVGLAVMLITMLVGFLSDNLQPLVLAATGILIALADGLTDNIDTLLSVAATLIDALSDALYDPVLLTKLTEAAVMLITAMVDGITGDGMGQLLGAVLAIITKFTELSTDPAYTEAMAEAGATLLASLVTGICTLSSELLGELVMFGENLGETLAEVDWEALGQSILDGICNGLMMIDSNIFQRFAEDWLSGFRDIFGIHSPSTVMRDIIGKNLAEGIITGFTDMFPEVEERFAALVDNWITGMHELLAVDNFLDLGKNIVLGIWDGIDNTKQWLIDQFAGFKDSVLGGLKSVFGIESPSKLMRDVVGKNLALGIGVGFEEEIPDVGKSAAEAFTDVDWSPKVSPDAITMIEAERRRPDPVFQPSPTSIVNNYNSYTTNNTTGGSDPESAPERSQPAGDIIIPVNIGGEHVETVVVKALQSANAMSGGVTV